MVPLTKLTPNQKALLDTLAAYPNGASYDRLKHCGGMMTLSSVMTAYKPFVQKELKRIHGDAELTTVYSLTPRGKARQQNQVYTGYTDAKIHAELTRIVAGLGAPLLKECAGVITPSETTLRYALEAYGHLIPFETEMTPQALAMLVQQTYDAAEARNATVIEHLYRTRGVIRRTRHGGTHIHPCAEVPELAATDQAKASVTSRRATLKQTELFAPDAVDDWGDSRDLRMANAGQKRLL